MSRVGKGRTMADQQATGNVLPSPSGQGPVGEQEIELVDYLLVIWRHRFMIVSLCFVAMAVTVAIMLVQPRRYRSSATIVPPVAILQKQSAVSGGLGGLGGSMLSDIMNSGSIAGMYVEILESREVTDAIINQFDLMRVYENVENATKARRELSKNTSIKTTDEGAVKIAVTDLEPNRAAAMANAYVDELDKQNKRLSTGEATSKRIFLEGRLKEVQTKLSGIENISAHEAAVQEMLYELLVRECEMAKIEEAKSMPTLQVLDEAVVPELPMARGTIQKGVLAGVVAMVFAIFWAFAREYVAAVKDRSTAVAMRQQDQVMVVADTSPTPAKANVHVASVSKKQPRCDEPHSDVVESAPSV